MTHNFRVGTWAKKNQTPKDHAGFLMKSTNAQRAIIHEMCHQALGGEPSAFWGHQPIPQKLLVPADTDTLQYTLHASKHAAHHFGRLISSHKKASGWISGVGEAIGDALSASKGYAKTAMNFLVKNQAAIKSGASITKDLFQTGTTIANLAGWIPQDKKNTLDAISNAINKHVQGEKKEKEKPKKGSGFRRIIV